MYENVRDSYLKTIYEIEPNSMIDVYVEIHGIWDYRQKENSSTLGVIGKRKLQNEEVKVIKEDQEVKRVGLIVNALKIKVLDIQKPYRIFHCVKMYLFLLFLKRREDGLICNDPT